MPTGSYITFKPHAYYVNLELHAAPDDWQSTEGLCGTFDSDTSNDFKSPDGTVVWGGCASHYSTHCGVCPDVCPFVESWRCVALRLLFGN